MTDLTWTRQSLTGWGRSTHSVASCSPVETVEQLATAIVGADARGVLARGMGRSYGDAAANAGGRVVRLTGLDHIGQVSIGGVIEVGAGARLDRILDAIVPQGWFLPVTPGTAIVTVGGAISADVHGKNHHRDGSFGDHVQTITVLNGRGEIDEFTAGSTEFATIVGGMGLAGIIVSARLQLLPIWSASVTVRTTRTRDLAETMAVLDRDDVDHRYTVAWCDTLATGRHLGRAVVTSGNHSDADVPGATPLASFRHRTLASAPPWAPSGLLNRHTVRAFNGAYYHRAPARPTTSQEGLRSFFHPLDVVHGWNRIYGRRGFLQHQFVVNDPALVQWAIEDLQRHGIVSFLSILKRLGHGSGRPLSFPTPGWLLSLDIPITNGLGHVLARIDDRIAAAGGRCYFAKDGRQRADLVPTMYPHLSEWQETRSKLDPDHVFASDLSRRLHLC